LALLETVGIRLRDVILVLVLEGSGTGRSSLSSSPLSSPDWSVNTPNQFQWKNHLHAPDLHPFPNQPQADSGVSSWMGGGTGRMVESDSEFESTACLCPCPRLLCFMPSYDPHRRQKHDRMLLKERCPSNNTPTNDQESLRVECRDEPFLCLSNISFRRKSCWFHPPRPLLHLRYHASATAAVVPPRGLPTRYRSIAVPASSLSLARHIPTFDHPSPRKRRTIQ
jgi:hypothetical protein